MLLGAAAACGGDEDGEAEFLAEVNAICDDYGPKLALLAPPSLDEEEWAAIAADMGDLLEASVNELRLLEPSENIGEDYGEWLDLRAEILTAMRDVQTAAGAHDLPALDAALRQANEAMAAADPLAEEMGFDACSPTGIRTEL
ncbi:MAG: hypothetical protein ACRDNG_13050 [Gaiellaceae bacterium]